jgi:acyl-coenzyme A synthetase/AMP-(fatty) acid ligase
MVTCSNACLEKQMEQLLSGPRYPEKEFVFSGYTFQDVYQMAAGLRSTLSKFAADGPPVCLFVENRAGIAAAVLASLAGAPPIVLPYAHSAQVLTEVHRITGATRAIVDSPKELPGYFEPVLLEKSAGRWDCCRQTPVDSDRTILGLYTGGSTGKPTLWSKTVKNLFSETFYLADRFNISCRDRFVTTVSPYHIYGLLFSVLLPFVSAASVYGKGLTFPQEIVSAVDDCAASIFVSVPAHYRILRGHRFASGSLKKAFSSAGVLDEEDGWYFYEQTGQGVIEIYGSTETGGIATRCRAAGEEAFAAFDPIDWKIEDNRLCVRSDFVSPEVPRASDGFVVTNDRAGRYDDHRFVLLGRTDAVIKVGGKRLDLEEIRVKLMDMPGVRDCAVVSFPVQGGRENAVAALVEADLEKTEIKKHLFRLFEPYALPRSIKIVDKMLYTPNGKYDTKAIEELFRKEFL